MNNNLEKNNQEKLSQINSEKLLSELLNDIQSNYGLDKKLAEKLIKNKTNISLNKLKDNINFSKKEKEKILSFSSEKKEKLEKILLGTKELLKNFNEGNLKISDKVLEKNEYINYEKEIEKYLPKKLVSDFKNPKNIHQHIGGLALGTVNSIFKTTEALYNIGAGIIKTPYHLYLIISGKGKINNIDKI